MPTPRPAVRAAVVCTWSAGAVLACLALGAPQTPERRLELPAPVSAAGPTGLFALEVPELNVQAEANSTTRLLRGDIANLRLRLRRSPSQVDYGTILVRVNTESANIVMSTRGGQREVLCDLDLRRRAGFELRPGRNSIEIEAVDRGQRRLYASFLLDVGTPEAAPAQLASGPPEALRGERHAVVVGVSRYAHAERGIPDLRFAARDATAMRDFLVSPRGGFAPDNVVLLLNENATSGNLRSALFTFLTRPGPDDLVVIYFAGHGAPDPHDPRHLYLITHDTRPDDMGGTAFPMWHLPDVLGRIVKARRVLVLADACHSQGVGGGEGGAGQPTINLANQYLARYAGDAQHALLTASGISEASLEDTRWGGGHGVFTHFALRGLQGAADGDRNGTVTAGELFQYVRTEVRRETGGRQTPTAITGLASNLALVQRARVTDGPGTGAVFFRRAAQAR